MPSNMIVMLPLLPGKQEAWRQFCQTLQGSRRRAYTEFLQRMGVTQQDVWLTESVHGAVVHIHQDVDLDAREKMLALLSTSTRPFDGWLRERLLELHGLDLAHFAKSVDELMLTWPPAHDNDVVSGGKLSTRKENLKWIT